MNPLFNGNMSGLIQQFNQFKQNFSGDPRQQIQQLMNSGRISQAQYDRAVQIAKNLQSIFGIK